MEDFMAAIGNHPWVALFLAATLITLVEVIARGRRR